MARFVFRLESIRALRHHMEQERKDALAREQYALNMLRAEAERLGERQEHWSQALMKGAESGISPMQAILTDNYISGLKQLLAENAKQTEAQEAAVERERLALVECMKECKKMDKLYERQFSSYTESENKNTEHELEDLISGRLFAKGY